MRKLLCVLTMAGAVAGVLAAPSAPAGSADWGLPAIPEDALSREECQGLIAILPVVMNVLFRPVMQRASAGEALNNGELVRLVRQLAQAGDGDALAAMGLLHESGNCFGGVVDMKKAQAFFALAAQQGNAMAAQRLHR
jgi:hypothetical protein